MNNNDQKPRVKVFYQDRFGCLSNNEDLKTSESAGFVTKYDYDSEVATCEDRIFEYKAETNSWKACCDTLKQEVEELKADIEARKAAYDEAKAIIEKYEKLDRTACCPDHFDVIGENVDDTITLHGVTVPCAYKKCRVEGCDLTWLSPRQEADIDLKVKVALAAERDRLEAELKDKNESGCCIVEHGYRMTAEHEVKSLQSKLDKAVKVAEALVKVNEIANLQLGAWYDCKDINPLKKLARQILSELKTPTPKEQES